MASKAKARKEAIKRPVLTRAKDTAREQIDQVLLGIQHSSLAKLSSKLKVADTSDLLMMVGRKVLEQAEAVRATIPSSAKVLKPFRAAARELSQPLKSATRVKAKVAKSARPLKKAATRKKK